MVLTSYFTTKKDWQRGKYAKPSFAKIQPLETNIFYSHLCSVYGMHGFAVTEEALPECYHKRISGECTLRQFAARLYRGLVSEGRGFRLDCRSLLRKHMPPLDSSLFK